MSLTQSQALSQARRQVRVAQWQATEFVVTGPHDCERPSGAVTEQHFPTRARATACRARWVAKLTLALMGELTGDRATIINSTDLARDVDVVREALTF